MMSVDEGVKKVAGSGEKFVYKVCRLCEVSTYLQIVVASYPQRLLSL